MKMTNGVGIYIHIPFCISRCNYCDFCSSTRSDGELSSYVDMLLLEILGFDLGGKRPYVDSIFFGGGTPSRLAVSDIKRILGAISSRFDVSKNCEITVEVNPATYRENYFSDIFALGVNRISFGVQSIHALELKTLGRIHTHSEFLECYKACRAAGFTNISVDLIYGIPHQSVESFEQTLREIVSLSPTHISAYALIIEEGTPFYEMKSSLPLPDEESEEKMYYLADSLLSECGYTHYEISNYSKDGYESRHNLKYWTLCDYIGFGISAHSCFSGKRFYNSDDFDMYMSGEFGNIRNIESETPYSDEEYIMLRLRTRYGIDLDEFKQRFGYDFLESRESEIDFLIDHGVMRRTEQGLVLTPRGFYLSNNAILKLI